MNEIERGVFKFKNGDRMIFNLKLFFKDEILDEIMIVTDIGRRIFLKRTRMTNLVSKAIVWEEFDYAKTN